MLARNRMDGLRLPKLWPRRVRSAVVHGVSLANVAFTISRNRPVNEGHLREIARLREELRIKDARMERLPAHRRPHYPPIERLAILELRAARGWSQVEITRFFTTRIRWRTSPIAIVELIVEYRGRRTHLPIVSLRRVA
jgi:hypothetical protein